MVWSQFHLPPKKTRRKHLTMCIPNSKAHLLQLKRNSFHRNSYSGTIWNRKCFILIFLIPERLLDRIARIWGGNSLREAGILRALSFSVFKGDGKKLLSPGTDQRSYVFFFFWMSTQESNLCPLCDSECAQNTRHLWSAPRPSVNKLGQTMRWVFLVAMAFYSVRRACGVSLGRYRKCASGQQRAYWVHQHV